jgi:hypothetical protein
MLIAIYHMLRNGAHFLDLGPEHWHQRHKARIARRSIRRHEHLGYRATMRQSHDRHLAVGIQGKRAALQPIGREQN